MTLLASLAGISKLAGGGAGSVPLGDTTSINSPFKNNVGTAPVVFSPVGGANPNFSAVFGGDNPFTLSTDPQSLSGAVSRNAIPVVITGVIGFLIFSAVKRGRK